MENKYYVPDITEFYVGYAFEYRQSLISHNYDENDCIIETFTWNENINEVNNHNNWIKDKIKESDLKGNTDKNRSFGHNDYFNVFEFPIRTKYLDIEDIESCGFTILESKPEFIKGFKQFKLKNYYDPRVFIKLEIDYNVISKMLSLSYDCGDFTNASVFEGECKSINEFRNIIKYLETK
jgi:hypothetical protein